jgi:hypothetical protein
VRSRVATPDKQIACAAKKASTTARNVATCTQVDFLNDSNDRNSATNSKFLIAGLVLSALISSGARASTILVDNASFETLPGSGLVNLCGTNCSFSVAPIPGWVVTGNTGQFQPGPPVTTTYFNSVPDGITVAYTNSGTISQIVGVTAQAGLTYTLQVALGLRNDHLPEPGIIDLMVGTQTI